MKRLVNILGCCLDGRVLVALAVVGGGVFLLAPLLFWTALPILAILACPLSMLFMMRGMSKMNGQEKTAGRRPDQPLTRLSVQPRSREEQLRDLQDQLERVGRDQAAVARQIQDLSNAAQPMNQGAKVRVSGK